MTQSTFSYDFAKTGMWVTLHTDVSKQNPEVTTRFLSDLAMYICETCKPCKAAVDCLSLKISIEPEDMQSKVKVMQFLDGFCKGYDMALRPLGMHDKTMEQKAAYQLALKTNDPDDYKAALRLAAECQEAAILTQMRIQRVLDAAM